MSKTKEEWDISYLEAKEQLIQHPDKLSLLDNIYNDPKYYAGYYTRNVRCNLGLNGSAIAEINHASVVAHLGGGGLQPIMEQLSKLLVRQQHLYNKEREQEVKSETYIFKYRSKYAGYKSTMDTEARRSLSTYAHSKLFQVELLKSQSLSHMLTDDNEAYVVWPTGTTRVTKNSITISTGGKCNCLFRRLYDY